VVISGNVFRNTESGAAITLTGTAFKACSDVSITGNLITATFNGISISNSDVNHVAIVGNNIRITDAAGTPFLALAPLASSFSVLGNYLEAVGSWALRCQTSSTSVMGNNFVAGGTPTVQFYCSTDSTFSGNTFTGDYRFESVIGATGCFIGMNVGGLSASSAAISSLVGTAVFYPTSANRLTNTLVGIVALANDATPPVAGGSTFTTGGTTTITDFDDGTVGQTITVLAEHALIITDGTHIILNGSSNFTMAVSDSLTLILKADNKWYETARMVNVPSVVTFADLDATPTVANGKYFLTTGTTAITDFDDGVVGQTITVKAKSTITITDAGDLELVGNFAMTTGDTITLTMIETGKWSEISRSNIA
jgi:hypothetical protein